MTRDIVFYLFATRCFDESIDLASAQSMRRNMLNFRKHFLF
jgi:hypothetical protein